MRTSSAWYHFESIDDGKKARCRYCNGITVLSNGSTGNLLRHLRLKHPGIPINKTAHKTYYNQKSSDYIISDEVRKSPEEILQTVEVRFTESDTALKSSNDSGESAQSMTYFFIQPFDENKRQEVDEQLLKIIVKNLYSFSIVEEKEFIKFVRMLNSNYVLPSRKNLLNDTLFDIYNSTKRELKSSIKDVAAVTLAVESWTSVDSENFISVTAHYLDKDLELKSNLLDLVSSFDKLSVDHIELFFQNLVSDWNLSDKILAVITNGAEDLVRAVNKCQWNHIQCFGHLLNQVINKGLDQIKPIISKVRNVVQYFKRHSFALNRLNIVQNQMGLLNVKLKKDVPSRWDTTFEMLIRFLKNRVPLTSTIEQLQLHSFKFSSADFLYLEKAVEILVVFNSIRVEMCSEKTFLLSKVPHIIRFMSKHLTNILEQTGLHPDIIKMGNVLKEGIKKFEDFEVNKIVGQCVLLDPRIKKRGLPESSLVKACLALRENVMSIREEILKDKPPEIVEASETNENQIQSEYFMDVWSEFDSRDSFPQKNLTEVAEVEIKAYFSDGYLPLESNPLTYWANISNQNKFPALFELAKQILCIPASSIPCHRLYSKAGTIFLEKRKHLTSKKIKRILFLHHNL